MHAASGSIVALAAMTLEQRALFDAALVGDARAVKALLAKGVSAKTTGEYGQTPLMYAAESRDLETVQVLLSARADPNARCSIGRNALICRDSG